MCELTPCSRSTATRGRFCKNAGATGPGAAAKPAGKCTCKPGSAGAPKAACSASAQAGLSRRWQIFQLTLSQTWARSASGALNTDLASRHTSNWALLRRVLPITWLWRDRPWVRKTAITASRSWPCTCSTTPSSSVNKARSVASSRRAPTWVAQFLLSPTSMRLSLTPSPSRTSMSTLRATPWRPAKAISATAANKPPSLRSW